jgi:opacity protein-like surface antigen
LGAGIEVPVVSNVSINLEYRRTDYGTPIYSLTDITTGNFVDNSVRAGVNYHFN